MAEPWKECIKHYCNLIISNDDSHPNCLKHRKCFSITTYTLDPLECAICQKIKTDSISPENLEVEQTPLSSYLRSIKESSVVPRSFFGASNRVLFLSDDAYEIFTGQKAPKFAKSGGEKTHKRNSSGLPEERRRKAKKRNRDLTNSEEIRVDKMVSAPGTKQTILSNVENKIKFTLPVQANISEGYCHHILSPQSKEKLFELVKEVIRLQQNHFIRNPQKATIKRRYFCGLKEVLKHMHKLKCIIIAKNIKKSADPDEVTNKVLKSASDHGVPVLFGLTRHLLGRLCLKRAAVSCMGIVNYQGPHDQFRSLLELVPEANKQYEELLIKYKNEKDEGTLELDSDGDNVQESVNEVSLKKADETSTQIIENMTSTPIIENTTTPIIENTTTPIIENMTPTPIIENTTSTPIIENTTSTPIIENMTSTPIIENMTSTPIIENMTSAPIIENMTSTSLNINTIFTR